MLIPLKKTFNIKHRGASNPVPCLIPNAMGLGAASHLIPPNLVDSKLVNCEPSMREHQIHRSDSVPFVLPASLPPLHAMWNCGSHSQPIDHHDNDTHAEMPRCTHVHAACPCAQRFG